MSRVDKAIENIQRLFPHSGVSLSRRYRTVHSEIFIFKVLERENGIPQSLFVKYANSDDFQEVSSQFNNQSIFHDKGSDEMIGAPKPLYVDPEERVIIMEYVEGMNLKQILLKMRPGEYDWRRMVDASAVALSRYHKIFGKAQDETITINNPLLESDIDACALDSRLTGCNLLFRARQFVDYGVWNIIYHSQKARIFMVDFPGVECVCTPHLDLARFRFSLKVIKQYPQFRFIRMNWWEVSSVYEQFLRKYCDETGVNPNDKDWALIDWLEREYGRKLQNIYESSGLNMRIMAERIYMRDFIRALSGTEKWRK